MDVYTQSANAIIQAQKNIIGPIALDQAKKVQGLHFVSQNKITISGDAKKVIYDLVKVYESFFGQASIEVCKDAIKELVPPVPQEKLPSILTQ